jgi:hypothetical protein
MSDPNWQPLKTVEVLARSKRGFWTLAVEYVNPSQRLKLMVEEITPAAASTASAPAAAGAASTAPTAAPVQTPPITPYTPAATAPAATPTTPPATPALPVVQPSQQKWNYSSEGKCTADGDPRASLNPATCLMTDAPPGALIAKIGGSTAGKTDGLKLYVVGSFCVIELDDKTKGPLFLTMNHDPMSSLERNGSLKVTISQSS